MKKNLFGAVAAGLALALAITSFGCESGNDDPLAQPYERKTANYKIELGKKFKDTVYEYTAAPTSYVAMPYTRSNSFTTGFVTVYHNTDVVTQVAEVKAQAHSGLLSDAVTDTNYSWTKYVNGVKSYNKLDGKWSGATTKGTKNGDVVYTANEKITLDTSDNTFKWETKSSEYEVRGLRNLTEVSWGVDAVRPDYWQTYKPLVETSAWDTLPYYFAARKTYTLAGYATTYYYNEDKFEFSALSASVDLPNAKYPYLTSGRSDNYTAAVSEIDKAIAYAKDVLKNAEVADGTGDAGRAANVAAAKKNVEILENLKKQADYFNRGATVSILDTETVNEKTTGYLKYYSKIGGTLIDTEDKAATNNKKQAMTGKFTITGDSYIDGATIVITEVTDYRQNEKGDKYVFTDDKDYYYKNDVYGTVTGDFPAATSSGISNAKAGSVWQKAARTLTISNKVLTGKAVDINYTNHATRTGSVYPSGMLGYFFGSSYPTFTTYYEYYKNDYFAVTNAATVDNNTSYSYNYVEKN